MIVRCAYDKLVSLKSLKAHPKNPNEHTPEQVKAIAKILKYQGWRYPVKVSNLSGFITAGHARVLAARELGWNKVPVNYQDYDDEGMEYADVTADNALAAWAKLNLAQINQDVLDLGPSFDLEMLGIKDFVLEPAEKFEAQSDEDAVPENVDTRCKLGDVWTLGRHRLMCGDSTSIDAVEKLMSGHRAEITFTSPPYNLTKSSLNLRNGTFAEKDGAYENDDDDRTDVEYFDLISSSLSSARSFSDFQIFNIQMLASNKIPVAKFLGDFRECLVDIYIWNKTNPPPAMAEKVATSAFEFLFIFSATNRPKRNVKSATWGRGEFSNVYSHSVGNNSHTEGKHGATFPVSLAQYYIENLCTHSVIDLFGGSGSTIIACEKTNRKCFMMELDPLYCDVILKRWEDYTGKKAERVNGG